MNDLRREETIFSAAVQLRDAAKRAIYLDLACEDDPALRARVETLLARDAEAGSGARPACSPERTALVAEASEAREAEPLAMAERIGHYKLLQKIGEGGCGVVYMAEQEEPVRRRVAFKIIKLGMDTKRVIARFEAERQALAMMDHPNIAKVLDAGATDTGRPYFVMELVRGIKITDYCDQNNLSTEARLELVIQVCHAIQHAHQKGIIHRDIKPSNILVTLHDGRPVPKVIDFGIAKATEQKLTNKTLFTAFEQFIGTPAYMSPEQAEMSGLDVDTRSDIYALGVLLYELLTGKTPFDAKQLVEAGLEGMRRIIREEEPERPSTKLGTLEVVEQTTIAKRRQVEPPRLIHQVRGDLDWIVMKCLEKDRTRRYDTANSLANDLESHLDDEPVVACPPTVAYRLGKLLRKHRAAVGVLAAFLCLLSAATATSAWLAARASRERAAAVKAARAEAGAKQESDRLRGLAEAKAASEAKAREQAQTAQAAEAEQRRQVADAWAAEKAQRQKAEYESYLAKISLAAGKVENREFESAAELLESCPKDLRHWEWGRLKHLCQLERRSFGGGSRLVAALVFPDAKRVLSASLAELRPTPSSAASGLRLQVHDVESGKCLAVFEHAGRYQSVLLSPTGRQAITTGFRLEEDSSPKPSWLAEAILWDTTTGKEIRRFPCDWQEPAHCAALSPNGRMLAVGGMDGQVKIFEVETGKELAEIAIFSEDGAGNQSQGKGDKAVWTLAFSPDGRFLLSGGGPATQVWNAQTFKEVHRLNQRRRRRLTTLFSPDSNLVFFSDGTGSGQFWNLSSWAKSAEFQLDQGEIRCAAFSADGKWLALGTENRGWSVVDTATGKILVSLPDAHAGRVQSVAFSGDGSRLLTAGDDRTAKLWELKAEPGSVLRAEECHTFVGHSGAVISAAFVAAEKQILTASEDGTAKLWDCDAIGGTIVFDNTGAAAGLTAISPDGHYVLTLSAKRAAPNQPRYQVVYLWEARTGKLLAELPQQPGFVTSLDFTSDSRLAILRRRTVPTANSLLPDSALDLWNIVQGRWVDSCQALTNRWASVALSRDGKRLYTGSASESCIWDVDSGRKIAVLTNALACLGNAVFSPDGRRLVTRFGYAGNSKIAAAQKAAGLTPRDTFDMKVWNAESGAELATYKAKRPSLSGPPVSGGPLFAFTMLPDNRSALFRYSSAGSIWDLGSGRQTRKMEIGPGVFSPDFRRFCVSGSSIQVLDFDSGEVISTLRGPLDRSRPSGFSPDGRRLWTCSADGMAQLWDADTGRELLSLKTGTGMEAKPAFSADGRSVLLIVNGQAQLLPAENWR